MKKLELKAEKRKVFGRKVKRLRNDGKTPAVIYGKDFESLAVIVDSKDFQDVYKEAGETNLVEIAVEKDNYPVLVHGVQTHPVTDELLHIDFLKVNLKEKVTAHVPVEVVGEAPAEKQGLGTLVTHLDEIEVESLPANIPDSFEVDVSGLNEVDDMVQVKDIKVDTSKVEITDDPEEIVVKIEPLADEEAAPVPTEAEEVEGETAPDTKSEVAASEEKSPEEGKKE